MPALAGGGTGGTSAGGAGGADSVLGTGGPGITGSASGGGGGGGGAGAIGGDGAVGGNGTGTAGTGGLTPGADGGPGGNSGSNGGGGGGGAHGFVGAALPGGASIGGKGGKGGDSTLGGGGGGGAGGDGAVITGTGNLGTLNFVSTGGDGGAGGNGSAGGGGSGGIGIRFTNASGVTVVLSGPVTGGNGGQNGSGAGLLGGATGGAGAQFDGSGSSVRNNNTVQGGNGTTGSPNGNSPFGASGGNGGTGMVFGASNATFVNNGSVIGGLAGNGGANTGLGNGGNGGTGGDGLSFTAAGANVANNSVVQGGNGGNGGAGGLAGGNGGAGGNGLTFSSGGTFTNISTVTGGNGGVVGTAQVPGGGEVTGAGGVGIAGSNLTITNSGTISGGFNGDGVTRANAIVFTGGTNVLELQSGSTVTGNVVAFSAADTLRLGGAGNAPSSFDVSQIGASAQYRGFGVFEKAGTSTWTLTGTNTGTQSWTINGGTLGVFATMANAAMTVNNGTLAGTGVVGATQVNAGALLAPGTGVPGTSLTMSSLAMQSGAIYGIVVSPATASFATVNGNASLGNASVLTQFASGNYVSKQYTILTAGSITGTFNPTVVNANLPSGFHTTLSYDATDVFLNLTLNFVPPTAPNFGNGFSGNQNAVGNALINFFNTTGSIPMVFGSLTPNGLTQVSGETATGSQQATFNAMGLFMGLLTDPFMNRGGGFGAPSPSSGYAEENAYAAKSNPTDAFAMFTKAPPVAPSFEQRWSVWAAGFGGSQNTSGNVGLGSNNTTSSIAGTAVGADYLLSPNTIAGFALAGGGTSFSVANGGTGRSDLFQLGAYVRHNAGPAYISAALAYGWQDITTNRNVTVAGLDQLRAQFNANAWSGRLEGGYRFVSPSTLGVGITPYAAAQFVAFDLPAYVEQVVSGTNNFALGYNAKDVTDVRSELGIRTDKSWLVNDGILTLRGRFAWAHDFDPDRSIAATFQTLPGASFVVNGAAMAADSALTTASVEMKWRNGWSVAGTFEGEFSNVTNSYAGKGVVRYQW
jgi:uncharacterized protein with beta-barrel porin domain